MSGILSLLSCLHILKYINIKKKENAQEENKYAYNHYKYIFKKLWQGSPRNLKEFIFEHKNGRSLEKLVTLTSSWARDMD